MPDTPGPSIALVVPAYNEDQHIGDVLAAAKSVPLITEIIVVNDGSTDDTAKVAGAAGVRVINIPANLGKGHAMQMGIQAVDADIVVFSDADIIGLQGHHFVRLIQPLLDEPKLRMTVGKFSGGRLRTDLSHNLLPPISGQRALRRELVDSLPDLSTTRFGAEIIITKHAKAQHVGVKEVILSDLTHVMKEEKLGVVRGLSARLKMYREMYRSIKPI